LLDFILEHIRSEHCPVQSVNIFLRQRCGLCQTAAWRICYWTARRKME